MTIGLTHPPHSRKRSSFSTSCRRGSTSSMYRCFQNYYHGQRFLNSDPHYIPNVRLSINHWQIRDLVQVDQNTGSVFHTVDDNIRVLSMKNRNLCGPIRSRNHLTLPYRPRCFHHASGGLVVAGGVLTTSTKAYSMDLPSLSSDLHGSTYTNQGKGLFSIYSPAMGEELSFQLGDMINNAVTIYSQQNSSAAYTSYVCNNDSNLYVIDISDSGVRRDRNIECEPYISLNNVHQSSDGRMLTVTGDSGSIFLVDPSSPTPVTKTISTCHDSGFGISYHHNEVVFSVAFQDGSCTIFDLRNTKAPLHEFESTRPGHQSGAFRTCRFLNSPIQDLLVVSEHLGRVHLIDMRDLSKENHQVIVFPFALNQFASYQNPVAQLEDDFDTDTHKAVNVYNDETAQFTAPLVYDYEYLTEVNPKLFKNFTYEPQQATVPETESFAGSTPEAPSAGNHSAIECVTEEPTETHNSENSTHHIREPDSSRAYRGLRHGSVYTEDSNPESSSSHRDYLRQSRELYQHSVNHINGEMEIAGLDWHENQLFVGSEDGGLLVWDVNVRARRSFGSFSYA